jgi:hypothetical protein
VYGVSKSNDYEYRLVKTTSDEEKEERKLIMLFEETDDSDVTVIKEEKVCDAEESWMLGEYNDIPVFTKRTYPNLILTEIESNEVHEITLPSLEYQVKEMCMYKHFIYLATIDNASWLYDIQAKTLQKLETMSPLTTTNCVVIKEDEVRIYGKREEKGIVKILRYKNLKLDPGSL